MTQTAKRNLTQPPPTPCARLPRSSPRHESPANPPKTRPLHEGESASHKDIHETQLHLASTPVTDQVHDPRHRHQRRTISRGKAGGMKPQSLRIMSDIGVEENRISEPRNDTDGSDELQQPPPLAGHCWISRRRGRVDQRCRSRGAPAVWPPTNARLPPSRDCSSRGLPAIAECRRASKRGPLAPDRARPGRANDRTSCRRSWFRPISAAPRRSLA